MKVTAETQGEPSAETEPDSLDALLIGIVEANLLAPASSSGGAEDTSAARSVSYRVAPTRTP